MGAATFAAVLLAVPGQLAVAETTPYTPSTMARNAASAPPGQPLPGLTAGERARFDAGRAAFERSRSIGTGLGPVFNDSACNRCHNKKGVGGAGIQSARLAGRSEAGAFDPLLEAGGPSLAQNTVMLEPRSDIERLIPRCPLTRDGEPVPARANVLVRRRTTPLFGLGLVDATPDASFVELARLQPAAIRGRPARVLDRVTGQASLGKLGWKAQATSLFHFSGLALLFELGVTSPDFPEEQAPGGDAAALAACDATPEPEDDGREVAALADFMRLLAPVAPLPRDADARAGDALFTRFGCDGCHVRELVSGPSPITALSRKAYAPFSDFLL
ncbi:MAG TPA: di-heme oxidoredictase family protein, partial [Polyangiaceae bacterium]|nr:di-heme oxidoredictase family protein [Polyangiaceae bacterium]